MEDEAEEAVRLALSRLDELSTDEKVEVNGDAEVVLIERLCEDPGRRADDSSEVGATFVDNGVRPRRETAV